MKEQLLYVCKHANRKTREEDKKTPPTPEQIQGMYTTLEKLANMLNSTGAEWTLVGGIGRDLHLDDEITQKHHDIDIELDNQEAQKLFEGMEQFGYKAYKNKASICLSIKPIQKAYFLYERCSLEDCLPTTRHIRLINPTESNELLKSIDIKFRMALGDGAVIGLNGKEKIIFNAYKGPRLQLGDETINLRNSDYQFILDAWSGKLELWQNYKKINETVSKKIIMYKPEHAHKEEYRIPSKEKTLAVANNTF